MDQNVFLGHSTRLCFNTTQSHDSHQDIKTRVTIPTWVARLYVAADLLHCISGLVRAISCAIIARFVARRPFVHFKLICKRNTSFYFNWFQDALGLQSLVMYSLPIQYNHWFGSGCLYSNCSYSQWFYINCFYNDWLIRHWLYSATTISNHAATLIFVPSTP